MKPLPRWLCALGSAAALVIGFGLATADERGSKPPPSVQSTLGGDHFAAGGTLRIAQPVKGDLIAAGGRIEQTGAVGGDAVLVGGEVRTQAPVANNLYAGGGRVHLNAEVGRNLRAVGGQVELASAARVLGNASLAGGEVSLRAPVKGAVQIVGSGVKVDAAIDGDVDVTGEHIELGPQARIAGALRWRSPNELARHEAAQVNGPVQRLALPEHEPRGAAPSKPGRAAFGIGSVLWLLGLMLLATTALALLPGTSARIEQGFLARWGMSLIAGFITLVCVPVALVLLAITVIGLPVALVALLLFGALLLLGYVAGAASLGRWGLQRWRAAQAARLSWRIGATLLALVAASVVARIPFLGALAVGLLWLSGLGAIVRQMLPQQRAAPAPAGGTGSA